MPKKFKFKLEAVLRYRQILRNIQEARLMQANNACRETEEFISSLDDKHHKAYEAMIENLEQGFSLVEQNSTEIYQRMLMSDKAKENARLARRKKAQEFEKLRYIDYSKQFKAIDTLKDQAMSLHQKELLDLEMKQIDDLLNMRYRAES
jgi:flagellar export protein FliJ